MHHIIARFRLTLIALSALVVATNATHSANAQVGMSRAQLAAHFAKAKVEECDPNDFDECFQTKTLRVSDNRPPHRIEGWVSLDGDAVVCMRFSSANQITYAVRASEKDENRPIKWRDDAEFSFLYPLVYSGSYETREQTVETNTKQRTVEINRNSGSIVSSGPWQTVSVGTGRFHRYGTSRAWRKVVSQSIDGELYYIRTQNGSSTVSDARVYNRSNNDTGPMVCSSDFFWKYLFSTIKGFQSESRQVYLDDYENQLDRLADQVIANAVQSDKLELQEWRAYRMAVAYALAVVKSDIPLQRMEGDALDLREWNPRIMNYIESVLVAPWKKSVRLTQPAAMRRIEFAGMIGGLNSLDFLLEQLDDGKEERAAATVAIKRIAQRHQFPRVPRADEGQGAWKKWREQLK